MGENTWGAATEAAFQRGDEAAAQTLLQGLIDEVRQRHQHKQQEHQENQVNKQPLQHTKKSSSVLTALRDIRAPLAFALQVFEAQKGALSSLKGNNSSLEGFLAPFSSDNVCNCEFGSHSMSPVSSESDLTAGERASRAVAYSGDLQHPLLWHSVTATAHGLLLPWMGNRLQHAAEVAQKRAQKPQHQTSQPRVLEDCECAILLHRLLVAVEKLAAAGAAETADAVKNLGGLPSGSFCCCKGRPFIALEGSSPEAPGTPGLLSLVPALLLLLEASSRAAALLPAASRTAAAIMEFLVQQQLYSFLCWQQQSERTMQQQRQETFFDEELRRCGVSARRSGLCLILQLLETGAQFSTRGEQQDREKHTPNQQCPHQGVQQLQLGERIRKEHTGPPAEAKSCSTRWQCPFTMAKRLLLLLIQLSTATGLKRACELYTHQPHTQDEGCTAGIAWGIPLLSEAGAASWLFCSLVRAAAGNQHVATSAGAPAVVGLSDGTASAALRVVQTTEDVHPFSLPFEFLGAPEKALAHGLWWQRICCSRMLQHRSRQHVWHQAELLLQSTVEAVCSALSRVNLPSEQQTDQQHRQQHQVSKSCPRCRSTVAAVALYFCCHAATRLAHGTVQQGKDGFKTWASQTFWKVTRRPPVVTETSALLVKALKALPMIEGSHTHSAASSCSATSSGRSMSTRGSATTIRSRELCAFAIRLTAVEVLHLLGPAEREKATRSLARGFEECLLLPPLCVLRSIVQQQHHQQQLVSQPTQQHCQKEHQFDQQQQHYGKEQQCPPGTARPADVCRLIRLSPLSPLLGAAARHLGFGAARELSAQAEISFAAESSPDQKQKEEENTLCASFYMWSCRLHAACVLLETLSAHSDVSANAGIPSDGVRATIMEVELLLGFVALFVAACLRCCLPPINMSPQPVSPMQQQQDPQHQSQQQENWARIVGSALYVHLAVPAEAAAEAAAMVPSLLLRAADAVPLPSTTRRLLRDFAVAALSGSCMPHALAAFRSYGSSIYFPETELLKGVLRMGGPLGQAAATAVARGALARLALVLETLSSPPQPVLLLLSEFSAQKQVRTLLAKALHLGAIGEALKAFAAAGHCCCCAPETAIMEISLKEHDWSSRKPNKSDCSMPHLCLSNLLELLQLAQESSPSADYHQSAVLPAPVTAGVATKTRDRIQESCVLLETDGDAVAGDHYCSSGCCYRRGKDGVLPQAATAVCPGLPVTGCPFLHATAATATTEREGTATIAERLRPLLVTHPFLRKPALAILSDRLPHEFAAAVLESLEEAPQLRVWPWGDTQLLSHL
ncbi:hypothetical protein cyc_00308 [Cyclospora cayetanensis]|uniref:Uncharacterized protein n=1 Tax=Cyclospora cayetanensis TaxID=88456 RepID=A0A1D3D0G4_9EIME|nr:hypothetical protein cyc_00308 [Cyclospora cayetanensis]